MNDTQKQAIQSAISNATDNIARAKQQKQADPAWKTGNNESIDQYIAGWEKQLAELSEGIEPMKALSFKN